MGWPSISIQEKGRCHLAKASAALCILGILLCIVVLITGLFILMAIQTKAHLIEGYNAKGLPLYMMIVGGVGIVFNIVGVKVCWMNTVPEKRGKWGDYLFVFVIGSLLLFLLVIISSFICFGAISVLEDAFSAGIYSGMKKYSTDRNKKTEIDLLQFEYKCCGSKAYTDWFHVNWINEDYMGQAKKKFIYENKVEYLNDDAPYSCCDPTYTRPCIHHHVHDNDMHYNYDFRTELTLYRIGCTDALMRFYGNTVLLDIGIVVVSVSFIELILVIMARFLQTSIANAIKSGDPEGQGCGYLIALGGLKKDEKKEETEPLLPSEAETEQPSGSQAPGTTDDDFFDDSFVDDSFVDFPPENENVQTQEHLSNSIPSKEPVQSLQTGSKMGLLTNNPPFNEPIYESRAVSNAEPPITYSGLFEDHIYENVQPLEPIYEHVPHDQQQMNCVPQHPPNNVTSMSNLPPGPPVSHFMNNGSITEFAPGIASSLRNLPPAPPIPHMLNNASFTSRGNVSSLRNIPQAPSIPHVMNNDSFTDFAPGHVSSLKNIPPAPPIPQ